MLMILRTLRNVVVDKGLLPLRALQNNKTVSSWFRYSRYSHLLGIAKLRWIILLVAHYMACLWHAVSGQHNHTTRGIGEKYMEDFYYSVQLIQGQGGVTGTWQENFLSTVVILAGSVILAVVFGNVAMLVSNFNANTTNYQQKMEDMFATMDKMALPLKLRERVHQYYAHVWTEYESLDGDIVKFQRELAHTLGLEVGLYKYMNLVTKISFWESCSPDFATQIIQNMEVRVCLPDDYVVRKGETGDEGESVYQSGQYLQTCSSEHHYSHDNQLRRSMQSPPSESEPFQRVTGPPSVPGNVQGLLGQFSRVWFSMQVSHRGRYSIERLLALEEYSQRTPWYRVVFVCVGTPLPMIAFVLSQECIPLQPPADGWKANYGLWIRAAILSGVVGGTVLIQVKFLIQRVQLSIRQMILVLIGVMSGYTAIALVVAATVVFPIPFLSISMIVPFFTLIVVSLWIIVGKQFFLSVFAHLDQLLGFLLFISAQTLMAVIYPAYQVLFNAATNTPYELPVILLLAFIKFITRNVVSVSISHMEDMIPEAVIFTVDFFNAVYVVTCMQQTSSFVTAATIILIDVVHTVIAIRSLQQNSSIILDQLHREFGGQRSERLRLLAVSSSLCHNRAKFETQKLSSVELRSCLPHALSPAGRNLLSNLENYSHKRPSLSIPWRNRRNASSAQDIMNASFRQQSQRDHSQRRSFRSASIHAMNAISVKPASTTVAPMAKDTQRATHSSRILQKSLGILFTSECLVLTEYLESVIPIFYASYVRVMVQLPSAPYHTELEGLTHENVGSTVQTVVVYAMMECFSFLVLVFVLHRNCGMRALYHLAFVLETQMPLIQSKLMTWMLLTLACRVLHFGVDFSFRFAWVGDNSTQ